MSEPRVLPTPPVLDRSARLEGHRKALELRRFRATIKEDIANGGAWWVKVAWNYPAAQGMKVYTLLRALPYVGPKKADALLAQAGIPRSNTVRACGPKQRERLFAALTERSPGR